VTRLRYPPELDRPRAPRPFDPALEGARYGLASELSIAIWERVCVEVTDATGAADLEQAQRRFHEVAAQIAARGGWQHPDVGKLTRVGVELDGDSGAVRGTARRGGRAPGREILIAVEARRWRHLEAAAIQRDDEAGLTAPRERPGADEIPQAMAALHVRLLPEQPAPGASLRPRPAISLLFRGATTLPDEPVSEAARAIDRAERDHEGLGRRMPRRAQRRGASARPPAMAPTAPVLAAPVQADGGLDDPFGVHLAAARGVAGGGATLPHLDAIQASFGHHDVGDVRAHVGGEAAEAAAAIGASAYATGDDVAFAATPDLRQAAHEAAHVVQQRGGVRLDGGVGQVGDAYEQHADAVAALVVQGRSAEALLDTMAHRGAAGGRAVQRDYYTEPITARRGARSEEYDRDAIMTATLEQLFTAYTMAEPPDPATPVPLGSTTVQYAWLRGRIGTVVIRGEIRSRLTSETPEQLEARRATIAALTGDPARSAELTAMIDEAGEADGAGGPVLLDEAGAVTTFRRRGYRNPARRGEMRTHAASDIDARSGTGLYAPCAGQVIYSAGGAGYGNVVRLLHATPPPTEIGGTGPLESVYAHLSARLVQVGDAVAAGQAIGLTGRSTGNEHGDAGVVPPLGRGAAHLHMAVIRLPAAEAASDAAGGRPPGHSSDREVTSGIEPDQWLAQLGANIGAATVFAMSSAEARTADADGVGRGGVRAVTRWSEGTAAVGGDGALAIARDGVAAASAPLPYGDRIQAAFGHHRVDNVAVAIGGAAAAAAHAIGARAYAAGDRIAFASAPSLAVAAHEAAHVVQQRRGDAPDGLGAADHPGERHADAVAAAVTRGESAEALLDQSAGGQATDSVQRFGDGESDTMRAHRGRGELYRRHGHPELSEGEAVHGGGPALPPASRGELDDELVQETLRRRSETGSLVPGDYVARILGERATHADVNAVFERVIAAAGMASWEAQMTEIDTGAPELLHAAENHWIHDPAVSGLDVLGADAAQYRDFAWDPLDYPGSPEGGDVPDGPHEDRAHRMARDLSALRPERRANRGPDAVATQPELERDAAMRAYILAHLGTVPGFSAAPAGSTAIPSQPEGRQLLDTALASFLRMREAALADGVALVVHAGWREADAAAAAFARSGNSSAVASYSAHMLGLAMDLRMNVPGASEVTTTPMGDVVEMRRSEAHRWIFLRGAAYGWYPLQNEPWHWEYNPPGFREQFLAAAHAPPGTTVGTAPHADGGPDAAE
jgi:hypothetical protein